MTVLNLYSEYKDPGVDWLGRVPAHWAVRPLGTCFEERRETVSDKDFTPLSVTMKGIVPQLETAAKTDNGDNRKRVNVGDFVINSRSDRKGSAGISDLPGSVSVISTVLTPRRGLNSKFVHYLLRSQPFQEEYYRFGTGIVADLWSTRYNSMKRITLAIPPFREQASIADFLDQETQQIDDLIRKQEHLIELLAEKRQAVIAHAVTKGLDPTATTKPSGIPWIGDVPSHWKLGPVKHFYDVALGKMLQRTQEVETDVFRPFLKAASIKSGKLAYSEDNQMWFSHNEVKTLSLREGDILVVEGGSIGQSALVKRDIPNAGFEKSLNRVRPRAGSSSEYFQLYMTMARESGYVAMQCVGATFMHLTSEKLGRMIMPVPPPTEQIAIAHEVGKILERLAGASERALSLVNLLRERRSALISAAVTGKINVTNEGVAA